MKIAVISDIHENIHNLIQAVKMIQQEKCEAIFCLGDVMRSKLLKIVLSCNLPVYFVFGNHDGNIIVNTKMLEKYNAVYPDHNNYLLFEIDNKKIFLSHYDELARIVAKSGEFDACFGGHLHKKFEEYHNNTLCVNPGEITGTREHNPSWYLYDTTTNSGEFRFIENYHEMHTPEVEEFLNSLR